MIIAAVLAGVRVTSTPDGYDRQIHESESYQINTSYMTAEAPFQKWLHAYWDLDDVQECYLARTKLEVY
jgi:hypothetical protein